MTVQSEQVVIDFNNFNLVSTEHGYTLEPNHYAPLKTYVEDGGSLLQSANRVTAIEIFASEIEANCAVLEMCNQGLSSSQIVVIAKDYQEHENSIIWEYITADGGLIVFLTELGINVHDTFKFVEAVEIGKFLVVGIITDRLACQAQYILEDIGHNVIAVY
ncbi:MAG: hypothetical protein DCF19_16195 [Pseudanabaena frigida]|uniref:Uncharacterized protein n=1 Tax=Pseudanabaena frigida TaxID=945775 RepID=A0A2W4VZV2_9CYAN|nr:MAG: hypothetical protein DCF19_16195 [Pseudanabaena frigida]